MMHTGGIRGRVCPLKDKAKSGHIKGREAFETCAFWMIKGVCPRTELFDVPFYLSTPALSNVFFMRNNFFTF